MAANKLEVFLDCSEIEETTLFLKRNMPTLRANPGLMRKVTSIINSGQAFIWLMSKHGLVAEMGYPLLEVVSLMQKGGCR